VTTATPAWCLEHIASLAPPVPPRWRRLLRGEWRSQARPLLPLASVADRLAEEGVELIHGAFGNGPATAAMVLSDLSGIPFTFETHAYDLFVNFPFADEKIARASLIVTESAYHQRFLEECGAPPGKVRIIHLSPNGQMLDAIPAASRRDALVVSICRLHPIKGLVHALRAVAKVRNAVPDLEYVIVGTGPLRSSLIEEVRRLDLERTVRFAGAMTNAMACALLREATVFLLPSVIAPDGDRDGTPTAIAEAMQLEVPVISSRISGIPELVESGVTGLLTDPGDVEHLADALTLLLTNPDMSRAMGRAGRAKVLREFNADTNAAALAASWRGVLEVQAAAHVRPASGA
jgi:glycosyltransferase involved in cell wall biosynthesis